MGEMMSEVGDKTAAEALRIAEAMLVREGWRFGPEEIGKRAKDIVEAMKKVDVK